MLQICSGGLLVSVSPCKAVTPALGDNTSPSFKVQTFTYRLQDQSGFVFNSGLKSKTLVLGKIRFLKEAEAISRWSYSECTCICRFRKPNPSEFEILREISTGKSNWNFGCQKDQSCSK